ncbi:hypothetical protein [Pseudoalteromonas luteoviolacea]|uniref:Uncharacterized protein n=1 Tax=Pseudoalteromonas luteoviolacea NCIMB 1942 TaxID=1365253 RepID=A0A167GNU4_9GAMM|nr:hypothetical protein [Pseudoalteromonas luteoviolacea]KZN56001.1 hypothetical protein N482_24125 [Pseudoalteromonas luteoviolacea NCIMB 1942]KZX01805.1 hypothetical protein JL49_03400 [Pseudoalteromonas luteoviolacea]
MKKPNYKKELMMLPLLLISIAMCIGGHFILQPNYQDNRWAEYSLAALPFLMFAVVIIAIKLAIKADKDEE